MKVFFTLIFLFSTTTTIAAVENIMAEIIEEKPIKKQLIVKAKLYPKTLPAYAYMLDCKQLAQAQPCCLQVLKENRWQNQDETVLAQPLVDKYTLRTRCVHTTHHKNTNITYISTVFFRPDWHKRTFEKFKKKDVMVSGSTAALPPTLRNMGNLIRQKARKVKREKRWCLSHFIARTYTPTQIRLEMNKKEFTCHLIEKVFTVGKLKLAQEEHKEATVITPLRQEIPDEKACIALDDNAIELQERINGIAQRPPTFSGTKSKLITRWCTVL